MNSTKEPDADDFPKLYNPAALSKKFDLLTPLDIRAASVKARLSVTTVQKAITGDPRIGLNTLVRIIEALEADYAEVFDPKFYKANNPEAAGSN